MENHSIWLVDDDIDDQYLFKKAFGETTPSLNICILDDGDELLSKLQTACTLPQVIVMDLNMSRVTGLEALQQVRQSPRFSQLPVIILSSSSNPSDRQSSIRYGANEYVIKPGDYKHLLQLTEHIAQHWVKFSIEATQAV